MNQPEKHIEHCILDFLNYGGAYAWKVDVSGYYDEKAGRYRTRNHAYAIRGQADIAGILPGGRALHIEVKTPTGKVSQWQQDFLDRVREKGGLAFVARSVDDAWQGLMQAGYAFHKPI